MLIIIFLLLFLLFLIDNNFNLLIKLGFNLIGALFKKSLELGSHRGFEICELSLQCLSRHAGLKICFDLLNRFIEGRHLLFQTLHLLSHCGFLSSIALLSTFHSANVCG